MNQEGDSPHTLDMTRDRLGIISDVPKMTRKAVGGRRVHHGNRPTIRIFTWVR